MSIPKAAAAIFIAVGLVLLIYFGHQATSVPVTVPQSTPCGDTVSLHLRPQETRVVTGGALRVNIELHNTGRDARWVYGDLTAGVWLHIYDQSGAEVPTRVNYEHIPPPPRAEDFVLLRPRHSLMLYDEYPASDLGLPSGRYVARVEFMFIPAIESLGVAACRGWLRTEDTVPFEVVE